MSVIEWQCLSTDLDLEGVVWKERIEYFCLSLHGLMREAKA